MIVWWKWVMGIFILFADIWVWESWSSKIWIWCDMVEAGTIFLSSPYRERPDYEASRRSMECHVSCRRPEESAERSPCLLLRLQFRFFRSEPQGWFKSSIFSSSSFIRKFMCLMFFLFFGLIQSSIIEDVLLFLISLSVLDYLKLNIYYD